ncbi:MAG: penicillin-binding transpeptidase domain-containing protein, partial [Stackebrandtia sp.]
MNTPLKRVTVVMVVLFSLLFLNLNWVQFAEYDFYKHHEYNSRTLLEEYSRQRGSILAGDTTLAESVAVDGGTYQYQRRYPTDDPEIYGHLTGYKAVLGYGGVEQEENSFLSGDDPRLFVEQFKEMITGEQANGGNVVLSVDPKLQEAAWDALTSRNGEEAAAVLTDPQTGQILAQVSTPSYDPTPLVDHDTEAATEAHDEYNAEGSGKPMLDRSAEETYPPGSTMKIITAAAALEAGMTPDTMVPAGNKYEPPNAGGDVTNAHDQCQEKELPLKEAFARSCNTTFAKLCVEDFDGEVEDGAKAFREMAEAFGFGEQYETPLPVAASNVGDVSDPAFLAQACFGQHEARQTPMQNALTSAAIANGGNMKQPQLVKELQAPDLTTLESTGDVTLRSPVSGDVAEGLREMMEEVVTGANGTGTDAQISGVTVGGKTGT